MTQDILDQAITQIRDRGLVISGDAIDRGIGTMTRELGNILHFNGSKWSV